MESEDHEHDTAEGAPAKQILDYRQERRSKWRLGWQIIWSLLRPFGELILWVAAFLILAILAKCS